MSNRFYIDSFVSERVGERFLIRGDEAFHFCRVKRGKVGEEIFLFDGNGGLFCGVVDYVSKDEIGVSLTQQLADQTESPLKLTVAAALPKGDRQKFLVEKLAELGVHQFIPVQLERSVARADQGVISRFQRYTIEAAKQCGRNTLMKITEEMTLDNLINYTKNPNTEINVAQNHAATYNCHCNFLWLLLHPVSLGAIGQITPKQLLNDKLPCNIIALIGPEGSFTEREVSICIESGFVPFAMGARILRTETACIAIAALLLPYAG